MKVFELLHAAFCETETGHHFVEDEEGPMLLGEVAHELEKAGTWENEAGVGGIGLGDDSCDLVAVFGEGFFELFGIVVGKGDGLGSEALGDSRRVGLAEGEGAGTGGDEKGVNVTVVVALELDDFVAASEAAGEAHTGHGGLGSGVGHADLFDGRNPIDDFLRHLDFADMGDSVGNSILGGLVDGVGDGNGRVSEDVRAPGTNVVDVVFAIDVLDTGAFGAAHKEGVAIDVLKGAHGGVHSTGNQGLGAGENLLGKGSY